MNVPLWRQALPPGQEPSSQTKTLHGVQGHAIAPSSLLWRGDTAVPASRGRCKHHKRSCVRSPHPAVVINTISCFPDSAIKTDIF